MSDKAQVDSPSNSSLKQPGGAAGGPAEDDPGLNAEPDQEAGPEPGPELAEDQCWTGDKPGTKLLIVQFCGISAESFFYLKWLEVQLNWRPVASCGQSQQAHMWIKYFGLEPKQSEAYSEVIGSQTASVGDFLLVLSELGSPLTGTRPH